MSKQVATPTLSGKVDHLTCFLPGVLALGEIHGAGHPALAAEKEAALLVEAAASATPDHDLAATLVFVAFQLLHAPKNDGAVSDATLSIRLAPPLGWDVFTATAEHCAVTPAEDAAPPNYDPTAPLFSTLDAAAARARLVWAADGLTAGCVAFYDRTPTGLAGEIVTFTPGADFAVNHDAAHSLLRPETVESLFILHRIRGRYAGHADSAWRIFSALDKHARVAGGGYASLHSVLAQGEPGRANKDDRMESFFLAETLKYLWLTYAEPDVLPLGEWVFNTEAHPVRVGVRSSAA